jgi:CheY-like chemotaxis protein
MRTSLE